MAPLAKNERKKAAPKNNRSKKEAIQKANIKYQTHRLRPWFGAYTEYHSEKSGFR
jgi:hypothetical protein